MYIKQNTNTIIPYGPFVASADGETAQTGLTIAQADIIINKAGTNTWAQKAATGGATAVASGWYAVNVGTGDSATVGPLSLFTHVSPALYVKKDLVVLPGLVYDSLVGGTDFLQTDSHQASGTNILTLLDNAISSRVAATAAVFDKIDVNVSSRFAGTAAQVALIDVATSSRAAATATAFDKLDVNVSSRLAATGAFSTFNPATMYVSAVEATATQVADKTLYTVAPGGIPVGGFAAGAVNDAAVAADAETAFANAVKAAVVEAQGSITLQQAMSTMLAVLAGVTTASGATFKDPSGTADRVTATLDADNQRTAITLTPSA